LRPKPLVLWPRDKGDSRSTTLKGVTTYLGSLPESKYYPSSTEVERGNYIIITQNCFFVKLNPASDFSNIETWSLSNVDFYPKYAIICPESEGGNDEQIFTH
jgi:hypothetical protein